MHRSNNYNNPHRLQWTEREEADQLVKAPGGYSFSNDFRWGGQKEKRRSKSSKTLKPRFVLPPNYDLKKITVASVSKW